MIIGVPKEIKTAEHRVALVPAGAESLASDAHTVLVEQGAGLGSGFSDDAYRAAGAEIVPSADAVWSKSEMILKVRSRSSRNGPGFAEGRSCSRISILLRRSPSPQP